MHYFPLMYFINKLLYKEIIMHGHDRHNTTILSIIHNMPTTYFGQYYFWPSSGWIKLSEKNAQYIIWYSMTISVGVSSIILYILCSFLRQLYPTWWRSKIVLAETCSWHVMYNWQYSCVMTVMSMHNCFLVF